MTRTRRTIARHMGHFGLTALLATALATTAFAPFAAHAGASPIDDKRAEAKAIQDQIEANGNEISALGEAYDAAQLRLDQANAEIVAVEAKITETRAEIHATHAVLDERAAAVYRGASHGQSVEDFNDDVQDLNSRRAYASAQAQSDHALIQKLKQARADLAAERAKAEEARAQAQTEQGNLAEQQRQLQAANAQQQALLAKVQGELQVLVQEEQARREAEAAAQARARYSGGGRSGGSGGFGSGARGDGNAGAFPNVPPPSPGAATAIEYARAQLGKPYEYAATGPNSFDCSGLTMMAWRAAGVYLPHYSGAQYAAIPHVPLNALEPGDLIFWGAGGSQHVGIYVGNGMMIHAPHTGDVVRVAAVYGRPVGAGRPG